MWATASGDQICFFFFVNIEKIKIRITKQTSTKVHRRKDYTKHVFGRVLLNPRTTGQPANWPPNTYPPTHRPPIQWFADERNSWENI